MIERQRALRVRRAPRRARGRCGPRRARRRTRCTTDFTTSSRFARSLVEREVLGEHAARDVDREHDVDALAVDRGLGAAELRARERERDQSTSASGAQQRRGGAPARPAPAGADGAQRRRASGSARARARSAAHASAAGRAATGSTSSERSGPASRSGLPASGRTRCALPPESGRRRGAAVSSTKRRAARERALAVGDRRDVARELHQVGLARGTRRGARGGRARSRPLRALATQELLGRHLRRAHAEAPLEVARARWPRAPSSTP